MWHSLELLLEFSGKLSRWPQISVFPTPTGTPPSCLCSSQNYYRVCYTHGGTAGDSQHLVPIAQIRIELTSISQVFFFPLSEASSLNPIISVDATLGFGVLLFRVHSSWWKWDTLHQNSVYFLESRRTSLQLILAFYLLFYPLPLCK